MLSSPNLFGPTIELLHSDTSCTTIEVADVESTSFSGSFLRSACPTERHTYNVIDANEGNAPRGARLFEEWIDVKAGEDGCRESLVRPVAQEC